MFTVINTTESVGVNIDTYEKQSYEVLDKIVYLKIHRYKSYFDYTGPAHQR